MSLEEDLQRAHAALMCLEPAQRAQILVWFCSTCGLRFEPCQYKCPTCDDLDAADLEGLLGRRL